MKFTTFAFCALSMGSALAQEAGVKVHVVRVGSLNGSLTYTPENLKAAVGDMVQFQFAPKNHTVTQSSFDTPCQPLPSTDIGGGLWSGFMPVAPTDTTVPTYTIMVTSEAPLWLYCSQGKHCQAGMVMVINENTETDASRSLAAYKELAKLSPVNLPGVAPAGAQTPAGRVPAAPSTVARIPNAGAGPISDLPLGTAGLPASTSPPAQFVSSAHRVHVSAVGSLGSLVAIGLAIFL